MKKLALFDFDNVIYRGHSVFDIIQLMEKDGFIQPVMWKVVEEQLHKYKSNEISYKDAADKMLFSWAKALEFRSYQSALDYVQNYFTNNPDKFFGWFETINQVLSKSYNIFIISTNYQFIAEAVVSRFGLRGYVSSVAGVENGLFTGQLQKSLAGNKGEVASILKSYPRDDSVAVGDSENDIDVLERVDYPICFQPDEKLKMVAQQEGWKLADENSILQVFDEILKD